MILTAHQPVYLPWLGLCHKIYLADMFCYFDIAQYQTRDFNNRNKIKTVNDAIWLTVPVESKNHFEKKICDIKIIDNSWNKKHFKSIFLYYKTSEYFDKYIDGLENILVKHKYTFLSDLNYDLLIYFLSCLNIKVEIVKATDYDFKGKKSDLVLDMCVKLKADKYIFGENGKDYADTDSFRENKIEIFFQKYNHPEYKQINGEFIPYLSVLDLLFNTGPESLNIILSNNIKKIK